MYKHVCVCVYIHTTETKRVFVYIYTHTQLKQNVCVCVYTHTTESLCCAAETNTIFKSTTLQLKQTKPTFSGEFFGDLVVRIWSFHCCGPGSIPGQETEIP